MERTPNSRRRRDPEPDGLTPELVSGITRRIGAVIPLIGADLVEVAPLWLDTRVASRSEPLIPRVAIWKTFLS